MTPPTPMWVPGQRSLFVNSVGVTPNAAANVYGAWVEQTGVGTNPATIPFEVELWKVDPYIPTGCTILLDLGISTDGVNWFPLISLPIGQSTGSNRMPHFEVPLRIPAGVRLGWRAMANQPNIGAMYPDLNLLAGVTHLSHPPLQRATLYGVTNTQGSPTASGATQGPGGWVLLSAATTNHMKALLVVGQLDNAAGFSASVLMQVDVSVGAAGVEAAAMIFNNLYFYGQTGANQGQPVEPVCSTPLPCNVPAGTRLSVRVTTPNLAAVSTPLLSVIGLD